MHASEKMAGAQADDDEDGDEDDIRPVKMTLHQFCFDKTREQIESRIRAVVGVANQVVAEAYLFANFHVVRSLQDPAFDVALLPRLDRNFYYRCLIAVSVSKARPDTLGSELSASVKAFDALRPAGHVKADITAYNQVVADLSVQMATAATNSVWGNIDRFVYRYLRVKFPELKKLWKKIVDTVVVDPTSDLAEVFGRSPSPLAAKASEVAKDLRGYLPLPNGQQFATRAHLAMRLFHLILQELNVADAAAKAATTAPSPSGNADDARRKNKRVRLFNLLPRKGGFTVSSIPISSMTLMKLLGMGASPLEAIKGDGRAEDHGLLWRKYFNVKGVETRTSRFDNRIVTDGKSVSIQRRVTRRCADGDLRERAKFPKSCEPAECRCVDSDSLKVGIDPGMTDVVTGADSDGRVVSVSSARFSEEAGYNTSRRRVDKWTRQTEALVSSIPTSKVATVDAMETHIRGYLAVLPELLLHRAAKGYRSMRFMRYVGKQKAIQMVCDVLAPKDKMVVVGFGNWNNTGHGITRRCSGPIKEIRMALKRRANVLYANVDEAYTSCKCHGCFQRLVNMKADSVLHRKTENGEREKVVRSDNRVHKVLHCRNSVGSAPVQGRCGTTWNRDVNAAKNILLLLKNWIAGTRRPAAFCWTPKQKKILNPTRRLRQLTSSPVQLTGPVDEGVIRCGLSHQVG